MSLCIDLLELVDCQRTVWLFSAIDELAYELLTKFSGVYLKMLEETAGNVAIKLLREKQMHAVPQAQMSINVHLVHLQVADR